MVLVNQSFNAPINSPLTGADSIMSELNLASLGVFAVKHHYAFASGEIHLLHLDRGEQTLEHQADNLHHIVLVFHFRRSLVEPIHDQEGRCLQDCRKNLGLLALLLGELDHV